MRYTAINLALAATVASGVSAQPHRHGHQNMHLRRSAHENEKREANPDVVVEWVPATATVYQIGESVVPASEAAEGIKKGLYVVVGETTPTFTPPAPSSTSTSSTSSTSSKSAALFIEKTSSSSSTSETPTPTPTPSPSSTSTTAAAAKTSSASSGATGLDAEFPSGEIDCSHFPSEYGAVALDWLGTGGWDTIQKVPSFSIGDLSISYIETGVAGWTCDEKDFCSYACPSGYAKTQWPSAQGSTGQSVGGLYCNAQGKLELTRPEYKTLCAAGAGGVHVRNEVGDGVAVCQTSYPGSESMVIPTYTTHGETAPLTNIYSPTYYQWQGKATTAQFYINYAGIPVDDACVWNSKTKPLGAGNWAPMNLGVGKDSSGITYISIFPNLPTSTAMLDFDVEFEGDFNGECAYSASSQSYTGGSSSGCTIAVPDGKSVTVVLKKA